MQVSERVNALDCYGTETPANDPEKALEAAGADFDLRKVPLDEWSGKPSGAGLHVVVREDTGTAIGQVGDNYKCFDNRSIFVPVTKPLIEAGARIERFQSLDDGRRAFMRLAWDDEHNLRVGGKVGDIVGRRCIISTAHDGKWAAKFSLQMLRLICSNGMTVPVGAYDMGLTHTVGGEQQLADLTQMVPMIEQYVPRFQVAADILATTEVKATDDRCSDIVQKIVDPSKLAGETKQGSPNRASLRVSRIMELFDGKQPGSDNRAVCNTGWGLYNAAVDYLTHGMGEDKPNGKDRTEQRFRSLLPGGTASRSILRAWDIVTKGLEVSGEIDAAVARLN